MDENAKKFFEAVKNNALVIIKSLIDAITPNDKNRALLITVDENKPEIAKLLLEKGARPTAQSEDGDTPLYRAARTGNLDFIKLFFDPSIITNPKLAERIKQQGITALMIAIQENKPEIVKFFLKKGINPIARGEYDYRSYTALEYAIRTGNLDLVKLFFDPRIINEEIPKEKIDLTFAVIANDFDMIKFLIGQGADPNKPNESDTIALILAIRNENLDMIKFLLEQGANINQKFGTLGGTPLITAIQENKPEIVKFLLKKGANPNVVDAQGTTPLYWSGLNIEMMKLLVQYGANVNYQMNILTLNPDIRGNTTILMLVAKEGQDEIVKELLALGADPLLKDSKGEKAIDRVKEMLNLPNLLERRFYLQTAALLEEKEKEIIAKGDIAIFSSLQIFTQTLKTLQQVLLK